MSNTDLLSGDETQAAPSASSDSGEQTPQTNGAGTAPKRRPGGLSGMVIAELRALATELGIGDTTGMRKGDLIAAIRERQGKTKRAKSTAKDAAEPSVTSVTSTTSAPAREPVAALDGHGQPGQSGEAGDAGDKRQAKRGDAGRREAGAESTADGGADSARNGGGRNEGGNGAARDAKDNVKDNAEAKVSGDTQDDGGNRPNRRRRGSGRSGANADGGAQQRSDGESGQRDGGEKDGGSDSGRSDGKQAGGQQRGNAGGGQNNQNNQNNQGDDDERGGRRSKRFRDRRRRGRGEGGGTETDIKEDDVLLPVAGILDVLENYAFVRTSGYLPGPNDVYVSLSLVRKYGLRRGDAITGVVKQPREGEQQRQKFNPLVRVDSINGLDPEVAKKRPEFHKLTPLYPNERLRLETTPNKLTTRVIDLVMPVGKGQRALIVSPPKAGKTTIMQDIANAITTNNPECHLMVVLVDERPEEVTDMQRSVKGEVIASTFDRPPSDHTSVAELSIERAKRLVEMGHDVVVLLDSITRLGRAYNLAAPASGRILSGGVDSTALFPPKRFLGAARNIEGGGSLTIFATAMVETGSTGDTVIFEEFKGTGNAELKLDRKIAERRVFPAVDVNPSGTRKEELLLSPDELAVTHKLHRVLHALDSQQAIDLLLDRLRKTKTNIEFLMQVSKTAPGSDDD
ncbi:transcription termination factor Rho [Saccharomonospora xinjiangensis]|uniref:Transcription termination factor Rho n=1 Tax=Saccharomonospora xinjiangensis XJ-54 TaxID=882086 RepID=I0V5G2_9PSEU|nr:transcription termination factor Rho [Saccharomonospora xinjiangensis]EID55365.1 transcription termination factor Rho [Saccharomonospora xinjiangensis XJ-54]